MNLKELISQVKATNAFVDTNHQQALCTLINKNINSNSILNFLDEVLQLNTIEISNLASLMEIHPLGFQKYVLWDDEVRARLHLWNNTDAIDVVENIHDHRFHFVSNIVYGSYIHEEYKIVNTINDKVEVELISRSECNEGSTYFFEAGKFHRIIQNNPFAVSFLVRSQPILPYSRVINPETMIMEKRYGVHEKFKKNIENVKKELETRCHHNV